LVVMTVALRVLPFGLRPGPGLADLTRCLAQREVASP
jgi:hypothetical protein